MAVAAIMAVVATTAEAVVNEFSSYNCVSFFPIGPVPFSGDRAVFSVGPSGGLSQITKFT
jgi:hypothetical protein